MPTISKNIFPRDDGRYEVRFRFGTKDRRRFFKTRNAAVTYLEEEENKILAYGQLGLQLKSNQFTRLMGVIEEIAPGAPTMAIEILEEFARSYRQNPQATMERVTVSVAAESLFAEWETAKGNKDYHRNASAILRRFVSAHGNKLLTEVTPADVKKWVVGQSVGNWKTAKARVSILFSHAIEHRWLADKNPCAGLSLPKTTRGTVVVPDPEGFCRYLSLAANKFPSLLPYLTIRLFAGLRASEARKIQWSDLDIKHRKIRVRQGSVAAKGGPGRSIPVSDNLFLWLREFHRKKGFVAPSNAVELEADLNASFRAMEGFTPRSIEAKKWHNALRHSYASHRISQLDDDLEALCKELGNSPQVALGHYIGAVTNKAVAKFWRIVPQAGSLLATIHRCSKQCRVQSNAAGNKISFCPLRVNKAQPMERLHEQK